MGVGTPEGVAIRLAEDDYANSSSQDEIITKLDNKTLEKIAVSTGGQFFMITPTQDEIQAILKHIASLEKSKLSSLRMNLYKEQYHLFAIVALLLLLIETMLSAKVSTNPKRKHRKSTPVQSLMLIGLMLFAFNLNALNLPWTKSMQNSKGNAAYKKQDYQKAEEVFGKNSVIYPKDKVLQYNHGNTLHRLKKDKEATEAWQKALDTKDTKLQSKAWHNLGNQQYQAKQYAEAMQSYRKAVVSDDQNKSAKLNYDLAKRMLMIQQQQNQQNKNKQKDQNNKDKDKPQPKPEEQKQDQNKKEDTERILKALEQKEVNDRLNRQGSPKMMRNNKWW
jgi:Ca-activated chloride channel family protein